MPIVKVGESTEVRFGHGDIEVGNGVLDQEEPAAAVCFAPKGSPSSIGTLEVYGPNHNWPIDKTPVRLVFEKQESINVVITALIEAKIKMAEKALGETDPIFWALVHMGNSQMYHGYANHQIEELADVPDEIKKQMVEVTKQWSSLMEQLRAIRNASK